MLDEHYVIVIVTWLKCSYLDWNVLYSVIRPGYLKCNEWQCIGYVFTFYVYISINITYTKELCSNSLITFSYLSTHRYSILQGSSFSLHFKYWISSFSRLFITFQISLQIYHLLLSQIWIPELNTEFGGQLNPQLFWYDKTFHSKHSKYLILLLA